MNRFFQKAKEKLVGVPRLDPKVIAGAAEAFLEYKQDGQILCPVTILNDQLYRVLQGREEIEQVALFALDGEIRILLHCTIQKVPLEVMIKFVPEQVVWTDQAHSFSFEHSILSINERSGILRNVRETMLNVVANLIPYGDLAKGIATAIVGHTAKRMSIAMFVDQINDGMVPERCPDTSSLVLKDGCAVLDLEQVPQLTYLWKEAPRVPEIVVPESVRYESGPPNLATMMEVQALGVKRTGVVVKLQLSEFAERVLSFLTEIAKLKSYIKGESA